MGSKMKPVRFVYILIAVLFLLASIKAGFALQEDFNAYATQKTIYACSCGISQDKIVLENTGDVASTYSVSQDGTGSNFSSITERAFSLKPGESKVISDFVKAPCGITGDYDLKTGFETVFGAKKELEQKIQIKDCVNIDIKMLEASVPVCPCSPAKYTFNIENSGTFLETYRLSIDSSYAAISENVLILEPQKSQNVTVFITTPCGNYGNLGFSINAVAESSGISAELPFALQVAPCYNYTMQGLAQYSVCKGLNNIVPITIKNTANVANTYFLDANADWAMFENSSISLWSGENKTVNLNVYPVDVEPANYNITIDAVNARGEIRKELNVAANVENCYSLNLVPEYNDLQIVSGEKGTVNIFIENNGTRKSDYAVNITGPEWLSIDANAISLAPRSNRQVKLNYDVPANVSGRYSADVYASMVGYPESTNTQLTFEVFSVEDAYKLEINEDGKLETNYEGNSIPLTFDNKGIREGRYTLVLQGDSWIKLNKTKIIVPAGGQGSVNLILNPSNETPEGKYYITLDAILDGTNIAYSRDFSVIVRQKTLYEKVSDFITNYWLYLLIGAGALILLLAVIFGMRHYRKTHPHEEKIEEPVKQEKMIDEGFIEEKKTSWLKVLMVMLLILLVLSGIGFSAYHYEVWPFAARALNETEEGNMVNLSTNVPEPVTSATIFINRTGLEGYGNVIEIAGLHNITIPLIIQNSDEPNTYIIRVNEDVSWIKTDKNVVNIPPTKQEIINIFVTPTPEVEEGNYNLSININIAGREKPLSEEIILSISEKEPFYKKYMGYLIGGLAALIVLLAILKLKDRKKDDFRQEMGEGREEFRESKGRLKWALIITIIALLMLAFAGAVWYFGIGFMPSFLKFENAAMNASEAPQTAENSAGTASAAKEEAAEEIPEEAYESVFIKKGIESLIPIKITNVNKTTTFKISVKEDVDWLSVENGLVDVAPNENKTINLIAFPTDSTESGDYKVSVDIDIAGGDKVYSRYFILQVRKNKYSDLLSYLYYVLAGVIVLIVLMRIITRKGKEPVFKDEEKTGEKPKIKKTNLRLE